MQVARRYLGTNLRAGPPALRARIDLAVTLGALVTLPVLVLAAPVTVLVGAGSHAPAGLSPWLWAFVLAAPLGASYATFALDAREGYSHEAREYLAPALLWPYVGVQVWAVVTSFLDEFVLRRPVRYVTSSSDDS
jgi:hypothetical protein